MIIKIVNEDNILLLGIDTDLLDNKDEVVLNLNYKTKDIAIGFGEWLDNNVYFRKKNYGIWYSCDKKNKGIEYTSEQLFNEYLNTLK